MPPGSLQRRRRAEGPFAAFRGCARPLGRSARRIQPLVPGSERPRFGPNIDHLRNLTRSAARCGTRSNRLETPHPRAMRILVSILTLLTLLLHVAPVHAAVARPPGHSPGHYVRWSYPSQMTYGPIENGGGTTGMRPSAGAFLTLPFMGPTYITSIFDHCYPDYSSNGKTCRYDGSQAPPREGGPGPPFEQRL